MKRWISASNGMMSTTSIFASFCGALVVFIVAFNDGSLLLQGCVFFPLVAFMLFAYTAEMVTDAVERDKVLVYVNAHAAYNLGVVMMLLSMALILFAKGYSLLAPLPVLGVWMPWLRDFIWLMRKPKDEWEGYLRELQIEDRHA